MHAYARARTHTCVHDKSHKMIKSSQFEKVIGLNKACVIHLNKGNVCADTHARPAGR